MAELQNPKQGFPCMLSKVANAIARQDWGEPRDIAAIEEKVIQRYSHILGDNK